MKKKLMYLLLAATMSLSMFAGCAKDASKTETTDQATTEAAVSEEAATNAEATTEASAANTDTNKTYNVGISLQSLENAYWAGVFGEVETLLKEKGWDYTILGCKDNSATQIQQIEDFTSSKVDLIMVHPSDPNALEDYLKQARDAGIKVMVWDDTLENADLNWVLDNTALGYQIGTSAAEFINEHYTADNKVDVAMLNYPQTPVLLEREQGILKALEELCNDNYSVVASQPALDAQAALSSMETILQANPNVKIVTTVGAGGDIGANEAFMTSTGGNIPADVGIFSADATQQQLEAIAAGQASRASVGFEGSNKRTATAVVDLYQRLLDGEEFPDRKLVRPLVTIDASNVAEYLADYQ